MLRVVAEKRAAWGGLRLWWGELAYLAFPDLAPHVRIARHFGLGVETQIPIERALKRIEIAGAGKLLAILSTESLVYRAWREPPADLLQIIAEGMAALGPPARFYTNVDWDGRLEHDNFGWSPASNSSFDAGVIAYNDSVGFLVWVEEED